MLCCATNTSVPGPPELPGDGPGWFSQMRAARLEMRDEGDEAFTALDNWTMQHRAADLDTKDTQSSRFTSQTARANYK